MNIELTVPKRRHKILPAYIAYTDGSDGIPKRRHIKFLPITPPMKMELTVFRNVGT